MKKLILLIVLLGVAGGGVFWAFRRVGGPHGNGSIFGGGRSETIEVTDVNPPAPKVEEEFTDDVPDPAKAPKFDPARIDPRPLGDWQVNLSATFTKLDCPLM